MIKSMDIRDLKRYGGTFRRCMAFAVKCGLPVPVKRIDPVLKIADDKDAWGFTIVGLNGKGKFQIGITRAYVEAYANKRGNLSTRRKDSLCSVLLHEIIHTCPDCWNHGRQWKKWARHLNANGANLDLYPCSMQKPAPWDR